MVIINQLFLGYQRCEEGPAPDQQRRSEEERKGGAGYCQGSVVVGIEVSVEATRSTNQK